MADFTPQEIEQFLQEFFDVVGTRQYTGARYVPIFGRAGSDTVEWDDLAPYEPLTVVMHQGVSYVSRRYVPTGIQITDTAYWVETYRFNAQVEQYRQEVLGFQDQIDQIRSDFVPFPDPDNYPKYGTTGQVLSTLSDGTTKWEDPVVPSDAQAEAVITQWLGDHPEATTTVQDNSLTTAKYQNGSVTPEKTSNLIMGRRAQVAANTDLNTLLDTGYYNITSSVSLTLVNKPNTDLNGTANLYVYRASLGGGTVALQLYLFVPSTGQTSMFIRALNISTGEVISGYEWHEIISPLASGLGTSTTKAISQAGVTELFNGVLKTGAFLQANTDLNTLVVTGMYGIQVGVMQTLVNAPENIPRSTGGLIVLRSFHGASNIATQILMVYTSNELYFYFRAMNTNTLQPVSDFDWKLAFGEMANATGTSQTKTMSQKAITDAIKAPLTLWGKSVVVFGDSRTWYDGHEYGATTKTEWRGQTCIGYQQTAQPIVQSNTWINQGVSGNTTVQICDRIKAYDFANTDVLIIAGGVNDFVKSSEVTIGSIAPIGGTFDTTTAYGDLQSAIEQVLAARPSMKVYVIVPAIAWIGGNEFPYATAKVRKDVAELYHLPYLDLYSLGGINEVNRSYFYCDDPTLTNDWYLHFNDYGNAWIGAIVGKWLNSV